MAENAEKTLAGLRQLVALQADNPGLWFPARYITEAYLQQALRAIHEAIEGKTSIECAIETIREMAR